MGTVKQRKENCKHFTVLGRHEHSFIEHPASGIVRCVRSKASTEQEAPIVVKLSFNKGRSRMNAEERLNLQSFIHKHMSLLPVKLVQETVEQAMTHKND